MALAPEDGTIDSLAPGSLDRDVCHRCRVFADRNGSQARRSPPFGSETQLRVRLSGADIQAMDVSMLDQAESRMMTTICTPEEAAAHVRPRDTIGFGLGPGIPDAFLTALGGRDDWEDLVFGGALLLGYYTVFTKPGVSYRSGFFGPAERILLAEGHEIELVPGGFRQFAPILGRFAPRIMTAQGAPPDNQGRVNLSLHFGATRDELIQAGTDPDRVLLVEVNPHLPRTRSLPPRFDNSLPMDLIDVVVEADGQPYALEDPVPTEVDAAIAANALRFVTDGCTLQTGIGAVPNIVATKLAEGGGGGYGVHSEMFTTGLMHLHRAGKVTNTAKGMFDGVSVTTFALGTSELYGWLDDNPEVAFLPVDIVNDPTVIGRVSINGALCLDLYGQVVADSIDGKQISGVGGHEDFVAGADLHIDAHSLICLKSTVTVGGVVGSRILPFLPEGAVVSTPRHHTGVVVTEYGAAQLNGLTVRERATALADIAHPAFRARLHEVARGLGRA
jgi:acyl-CoA hydrolase